MKRKMISKIITVTVVILTIASTKINLVSTQEIKGAEEMGNQNQVSDIKTNSVTTKNSVSQVNTTSQNATDLTHAKVETQTTEMKTTNSTVAESVIADNAVHQAQPSAEPPIVSSSSSTESKTQTTEMKTNNSTLAEGGIVDNAVHQAQPSAEQPIVSSSSSTESKTQTTEMKTNNSTLAEGGIVDNAVHQAHPSAEPPIVSSSSSTESKTQTTEMKTNNSTLAEGGIVDNAVHQAQPSAEQPIVSSSSSTESKTQTTEMKTNNSTVAEGSIADNAVHQAQPSAEPPIVSSSSSTESKTQTTEMKTNNSTLAEGGIGDNAVHQAQPSAEPPIVSSSSSTESKTQTTETKTKNSTIAEGRAEGNAIVQTKQANEHTTNSSPVTQDTIGKEKTATEDAAVVPGGGTAVLSNGTLNSVNDLNVQRMPLANSQHQELPFSPQQKSLSHTNRDIDLALRIAPSDPTDNGSKSSSGTAEIPPQSTGGTTFKPPSPSETPVEFSSSGFKPPQPEIAKPVLPAENLVSVSEVVQSPVARTGASNGQAHNPIESSLGASEIPRQSTGGTTFKPPRSSETPVEFSSSGFKPPQPETAKPVLPKEYLVSVSEVVEYPVARKGTSNGQAHNPIQSSLDASEIPRQSTGGTTFKPPSPSETPVEFSSSGFKPLQPETAKPALPKEYLISVSEVVQYPVARKAASNGQADNGIESSSSGSALPQYNIMQYPKFNQDSTTNVGLEPPVAVTSVPKRESAKKSSSGGPGIGQYEILGYVKIDENFDSPHQPATQLPAVDRRPPEDNTNNRRRFLPNGCRIPNYEMVGCIKSSEVP
ncbi:uncharacterized protein LOC135167634 isoform X5 [Diachasmimorpha longicaudata]|uniref:uncharacterized protein LOC135167634 isoform X5 n=1 Tax=Diachasmimorpha longicaudata TaxID=58733 RepID=UPI0030B87039